MPAEPRIRRKPPPSIDPLLNTKYPSPDPADPFAPLWVLRNRSSSLAGNFILDATHSTPELLRIHSPLTALTTPTTTTTITTATTTSIPTAATTTTTTAAATSPSPASAHVNTHVPLILTKPNTPPPHHPPNAPNNPPPRRSHYTPHSQANRANSIHVFPRSPDPTTTTALPVSPPRHPGRRPASAFFFSASSSSPSLSGESSDKKLKRVLTQEDALTSGSENDGAPGPSLRIRVPLTKRVRSLGPSLGLSSSPRAPPPTSDNIEPAPRRHPTSSISSRARFTQLLTRPTKLSSLLGGQQTELSDSHDGDVDHDPQSRPTTKRKHKKSKKSHPHPHPIPMRGPSKSLDLDTMAAMSLSTTHGSATTTTTGKTTMGLVKKSAISAPMISPLAVACWEPWPRIPSEGPVVEEDEGEGVSLGVVGSEERRRSEDVQGVRAVDGVSEARTGTDSGDCSSSSKGQGKTIQKAPMRRPPPRPLDTYNPFCGHQPSTPALVQQQQVQHAKLEHTGISDPSSSSSTALTLAAAPNRVSGSSGRVHAHDNDELGPSENELCDSSQDPRRGSKDSAANIVGRSDARRCDASLASLAPGHYYSPSPYYQRSYSTSLPLLSSSLSQGLWDDTDNDNGRGEDVERQRRPIVLPPSCPSPPPPPPPPGAALPDALPHLHPFPTTTIAALQLALGNVTFASDYCDIDQRHRQGVHYTLDIKYPTTTTTDNDERWLSNGDALADCDQFEDRVGRQRSRRRSLKMPLIRARPRSLPHLQLWHRRADHHQHQHQREHATMNAGMESERLGDRDLDGDGDGDGDYARLNDDPSVTATTNQHDLDHQVHLNGTATSSITTTAAARGGATTATDTDTTTTKMTTNSSELALQRGLYSISSGSLVKIVSAGSANPTTTSSASSSSPLPPPLALSLLPTLSPLRRSSEAGLTTTGRCQTEKKQKKVTVLLDAEQEEGCTRDTEEFYTSPRPAPRPPPSSSSSQPPPPMMGYERPSMSMSVATTDEGASSEGSTRVGSVSSHRPSTSTSTARSSGSYQRHPHHHHHQGLPSSKLSMSTPFPSPFPYPHHHPSPPSSFPTDPTSYERSLPSPTNLSHAASLYVTASDGSKVVFGSLWKEKRVVVVFIRHFWCAFCQEYVEGVGRVVQRERLGRAVGATATTTATTTATMSTKSNNSNFVGAMGPGVPGVGIITPNHPHDGHHHAAAHHQHNAHQQHPSSSNTDQCNVEVVIIGNGSHNMIAKYRQMLGVGEGVKVYTDPTLEVYRALGMGSGKEREREVKEREREKGGGRAMSLGGRKKASNAMTTTTTTLPSENEITTATVDTDSEFGVLSSSSTTKSKPAVKNGGKSYVKRGFVGGLAMVVVRALKVGMPVWEKGGDVDQLGGEFVFGPGLNCTYAHRMTSPKGHAPIEDVLRAAGVPIRRPSDIAAVEFQPGQDQPVLSVKSKSKSKPKHQTVLSNDSTLDFSANGYRASRESLSLKGRLQQHLHVTRSSSSIGSAGRRPSTAPVGSRTSTESSRTPFPISATPSTDTEKESLKDDDKDAKRRRRGSMVTFQEASAAANTSSTKVQDPRRPSTGGPGIPSSSPPPLGTATAARVMIMLPSPIEDLDPVEAEVMASTLNVDTESRSRIHRRSGTPPPPASPFDEPLLPMSSLPPPPRPPRAALNIPPSIAASSLLLEPRPPRTSTPPVPTPSSTSPSSPPRSSSALWTDSVSKRFSMGLMSREEEDAWMQQRQRSLEKLQERKHARRRIGSVPSLMKRDEALLMVDGSAVASQEVVIPIERAASSPPLTQFTPRKLESVGEDVHGEGPVLSDAAGVTHEVADDDIDVVQEVVVKDAEESVDEDESMEDSSLSTSRTSGGSDATSATVATTEPPSPDVEAVGGADASMGTLNAKDGDLNQQ